MRYLTAFFVTCFIAGHGLVAQETHDTYKGYDNPKKMTVAVSDFIGHGLNKEEVFTLTDAFRSYLINTGRFRVMERGQMDEIMKEQGFQQSGSCTDQECIVEMGQLLGVEYIIAGSIGKVGGTYSVNARLISVGTGEILKTVSKFHKGAIDGLLTTVLQTTSDELGRYGKRTAPRPIESVVQKNPSQENQEPAQPEITDEKKEKKRAKKEKVAEKKEKKRRPVLWIGLGTVVVGGGVAAFFLFGPTDENEGPPEPLTGSIEITWQ